MKPSTRTFLELFPGRITFQTFDDKGQRDHLARITHDPAELAGLNDQGAGIYFMVNEGTGAGRKNRDVTTVRAIFVDFDGASLPETWPLQPSIIVETSSGKYHVYWLVADFPTDNILFNRQQEATALRVGAKPHDAKGLARVMRLPGYYHQKGDPFLCTVVYCRPELVYTTTEIQAAFPLPQVQRRPVNLTSSTSEGSSITPEKVISIMLERATDSRGRNQLGFDIACQIRDNGFTQSECVAVMTRDYLDAVAMAGDHPYTENELRVSIRQAYSEPAREPWTKRETYRDRAQVTTSGTPTSTPNTDQPLHAFKMTDLGNAERLVARHGHTIAFTPEQGWYAWDGSRWRLDDLGRVEQFAKETVRAMYTELPNIAEEGIRESFAKHATRSEKRASITNMVSLAQSEPGISINIENFDQDPDALNTPSGLLNLRTGIVTPHDPQSLITQRAPIPINNDAGCPNWIAFQRSITNNDEDLIRFKQKAYGYSLSGHIHEQVVFIAYGSGANGKSTELETIRKILGDYASHTDFGTFAPQRKESVRNDLARLRSARFVTAIESDVGVKLNESLIKSITGGEPITARFLHKEYFEFTPRFKVWLATNHLPRITGTDHGIWRRIRLVPYNVTIPAEKQDKQLAEKLEREMPGILQWIVEGYRLYLEEGLGMPAAVMEATQQYRDEMDAVAQFVEDCIDDSPLERLSNPDLRRTYEWWCEQTGQRPMSATALTLSLRERSWTQIKSGGRYWVGVKVRPNIWDQVTFGKRYQYAAWEPN